MILQFLTLTLAVALGVYAGELLHTFTWMLVTWWQRRAERSTRTQIAQALRQAEERIQARVADEVLKEMDAGKGIH